MTQFDGFIEIGFYNRVGGTGYFRAHQHTHELIPSELPDDEGVLYCWLCDTNAEDLPDEEEVLRK